MEDLLPFDIPTNKSSIIKVIGVGGGGSNAVNHMFKQGIKDVDFVVCNTDQQALEISPVDIKIHLGKTLTEGLGAGNQPARGKEAAIENIDDVIQILEDNTKMTFITAGMGGGTGTGAAPIIAKASKELGILTIGIVTIPFRFEGKKRINQALEGVKEISKHVDSLLVINNEKLREIYGELEITDAFSKADNVLTVAARGIAEIITKKGHVNVDFADVKTVMENSGVAIMGSGQGEGENRAKEAIEEALKSPLLSSNDITGAKNILLNVSFDEAGLKTDELIQMTEYAQDATGGSADVIWGYNYDDTLGKKLNVTIIATGFKTDIIPELYKNKVTGNNIVNNFNKADEVRKSKIIDNVELEVEYTNNNINIIPNNTKQETTSKQLIENGYTSKKYDDITIRTKRTEKENSTDEDNKVRLALERMALMEKATKQKQNSKNKQNENEKLSIDELENEPAYKRKNIDSNINKKSTEKSRFVIKDEDDSGLSENSFLHDNVD